LFAGARERTKKSLPSSPIVCDEGRRIRSTVAWGPDPNPVYEKELDPDPTLTNVSSNLTLDWIHQVYLLFLVYKKPNVKLAIEM
jgi:hypothetical protein